MVGHRHIGSIRLCVRGHLEVDSAIVVLVRRRRQIEIGERNLTAMAVGQIEESVADNRIILNFELVTVLEHENGVRLGRSRFSAADIASFWCSLRNLVGSVIFFSR